MVEHKKNTTTIHECENEDIIQEHSLRLTELTTEVHFKKEKIDQIIHEQNKMSDKMDTLIETVSNMQMKSIMGDNDLKNRVTSIESELSTVRWMLGITLTVLALLISALAFLLTHMH